MCAADLGLVGLTVPRAMTGFHPFRVQTVPVIVQHQSPAGLASTELVTRRTCCLLAAMMPQALR